MILRVLTVDDSTIITTHLDYILKGMKEVKWIGHAFCIKEAEDLIRIKKPDVVLLDIMLKEENGFDLLKNINNNYPDIVVLMLSNRINSSCYKKSILLGALYLIDKSYEFYNIPNFLMAIHSAKNIGQIFNRFDAISLSHP
ncbi:MAG: response regulator transcription factor [Flavobacteriaceae bacterium]|nr:response regulator transcription factor [Flavobacteriaceae bacterium]